MRLVLDTNTLVSGVISANGPPRRLLNAASRVAHRLRRFRVGKRLNRLPTLTGLGRMEAFINSLVHRK